MATLEQQSTVGAVRLSILIVGAGLGGLAAAISCAISGHSIIVLESAKELAEVGAGLAITPNGSRLLRQWSLLQHVWDNAAEPTRLCVHRYSGEILTDDARFKHNIQERYGEENPFIDLHRVDLQRAMYDRAVELGVQFRMGERLDSISASPHPPTAKTEAGTTFTADLIIGADGLWSRTRTLLSSGGSSAMPSPTGDLAYRIVLHAQDLSSPSFPSDLLYHIRHPSCHFWIGPSTHAVAYSLRAGSSFNIVLLCPDDLPPNTAHRQPASIDEMRHLFSDWDPLLQRFLQHVDSAEKWRLMHLHDTLPRWVNEQSNLVLLGDACHPMLPYLAQGANSALEDGAVLGALLSPRYLQNKTQVPEALARYELLRKERGERVKAETEGQRRDLHLHDGPEQKKRDEVLRRGERDGDREGKGREEFPSRWTCPVRQRWLFGYDAYREVEESMRERPFGEG
ncbi:MAG: hypothetical protein Q9227_009111 [Pyrenula ochraceoflavens]